MTEKYTLLILAGLAIILGGGDAFYQSKLSKNLPTVWPKTTDELKKALVDNTPRKVVLNKIFDFSNDEGYATEQGCYHLTSPKECITKGQQKLNVNNQCAGLTWTKVTYSKAGPRGLPVGSNKVIVGENNGGLKGKGLRLDKSCNVEIRNVRITDINPHLIWGGDAIDLVNVNNVLVDGVYIKNIGRQMIVSHYGPSTGVTISNSVFDGYSTHAANCKGNHYWLWLFLGQGDQITLQNNVVFGTAGRGPKLHASNDKKTLLHIIQNTFYDVTDSGLLDVGDSKSSVLMEGNVFVNVAKVVSENLGHVFMPHNAKDAKTCEPFLGRECLRNIIVGCGGNTVTNSNQVMYDFKGVRNLVAKPISMRNSMTKLTSIPAHVRKYIA